MPGHVIPLLSQCEGAAYFAFFSATAFFVSDVMPVFPITISTGFLTESFSMSLDPSARFFLNVMNPPKTEHVLSIPDGLPLPASSAI
jgi:hypothetical protein